MSPGPVAPAGDRYRSYVLALLTAVGVCSWVDRQVFAILMESIKSEFVLTDTQMGLLGGIAFSLFYATLGLPVAWLADRLDRRHVISVALALWSAATAACGLATGFGTLLLGRVAVGVGEAGGTPPSHSVIADYFPPERRGFALGVFSLYIPLGFLAGFALGGWIDELFGWRQAFAVVGAPGLVLALVVRLTLREPPRSVAPASLASSSAAWASFREAALHFWRKPAMRHVSIAGAVHGIGAWGVAVWVPSFFMRVHGMGSGEAGTWLALVFGAGGAIGVVAGGRFADRLAHRTGDARWYLWFSAAGIVATVPFSLVAYLAPHPGAALASLFLAITLGHGFLGPVMAMIQGLAGPGRRAQGAAYYLFLANVVSMGLGPLVVGAISDVSHGTDGLRYALLGLVAVTSVWAALHFVQATTSLRADLEATELPARSPV